ncbi:hypothetical protein OF829_15540 [Sphingomonas sp. LB-2]|uniref:hypothetical protein n=1 Tax=Sphingomonas caeni TaxID=2984949 RepID=UPI00223175EB|nr:hypothetical protein [Sphingomonas caeni]MCW3848648.1 hypothetical protein [Sphingomonas caeni]
MPAITQATQTAPEIPHPADALRAAREWQAHLDAGRLTAAAPRAPSPQIVANRARTETLLRAHAAARREALRTTGFWERD